MPEQLASEVELPELTSYLWRYFAELHAERSSNGFGPNRITSTGIKDWCSLNRIKLDPWEIKAIKRIDQLWMETNNG